MTEVDDLSDCRLDHVETRPVAPPAPEAIELSLLGRFELRVGGAPLHVPANVRRLVALLALQGRPTRRGQVAGTLWLMTSEERANANLRNALWRAERDAPGAIAKVSDALCIGPDVHIDYASVTDFARHAVDVDRSVDTANHELDVALLTAMALDPGPLAEDLLPDWDEDWVLIEQERYRQLRLHALEATCSFLSSVALHSHAIEIGWLAVSQEPLRESAQRCLIEAHLADGNICEARRQYDSFAQLLVRTFGVEPSDALFHLAHSDRAGAVRRLPSDGAAPVIR